jgi:O-antigen/teichoic acid export membrane protein
LPLVLSSVVSNLMLLLDNWLVNWYYQDPAVFAVYRYGAREFPLVPALLFALGASLVPVIAENQALGLAELKRRTTGMMHVLFPMTALAMLTSDWWFPMVFNQNFRESAFLFNIYLLTLCSRVLLPYPLSCCQGAIAGAVFRITLLELAVKLILGLTFISFCGLPGLAFSVVLSSLGIRKAGLIWLLGEKAPYQYNRLGGLAVVSGLFGRTGCAVCLFNSSW